MQTAVEALIALGPLPKSTVGDAGALISFEEQITKVRTPVSNEEARALASLFGPDDCFGLAWSLLHLVETAPDWPIEDVLQEMNVEWSSRLWERSGGGKADKITKI